VRADIGATREQLRETVAALGEKIDVKRRAEQKLAETKAAVRHEGQELSAKAPAHPAIPLVAAVVIRRRRDSSTSPTPSRADASRRQIGRRRDGAQREYERQCPLTTAGRKSIARLNR
jgi:hypothetical protein